MGNALAGEFDRRITVMRCNETKDAAGDVVQSWDPPAEQFDRWAMKGDRLGGEVRAAQQVVRDADTVWTVRWDSQSRTIAPETFRVMWRGTVYEIVSIAEGGKGTRFDTIDLLCSSRPDLRGARGRENASSQP